MAESELLRVRITSLLINKYASILRVMSQYSTCCRNCQEFYFIVLDIGLALTVQAKNIDIAMAITMIRTS